MPGKSSHKNNTHHSIYPQESKSIRTAYDINVSTVLPILSPRTADINTCKYNYKNMGQTPSKSDPLPGTPYMVDPSTSSVMVYTTSPSVSRTQTPAPTQTTPSSHSDTPTSLLVFMPPGYPLIEPKPQEEGEGLLVSLHPLNPQNGYPDPWNSELTHTIPLSVRQVALADSLDSLKPLLDILNS